MKRMLVPLAACALLLVLMMLAAARAADAATYRDPDAGIEVRVKRGTATLTYADPVCGLSTTRRLRVRDRRFGRRATATCEPRLGELRSSTLLVSGRIARRTVRGRIGPHRFVARRGAPRPTPARLCDLRGATRAETALVRVYTRNLRTVACRRSDGLRAKLAEVDWDEARYYATGIDAPFVEAHGSLIGYAEAPVDTARSKYAMDPGYETDIVVRDLNTGSATRTRAEVFAVTGFAMRVDGAVAWAGPPSMHSYRDVLVQTVEDGNVRTLDRGPIDAKSLRVVDGQFTWNRD